MGNESQEWLNRAKSALSLAKTPPTQDIFLEDLCFQAQQAVEKSLKGILVHQGQNPPRSHNIAFLLKEVSRRIEVPRDLEEVVELTEYSVMTRYPGDYPPVQASEHTAAIEKAEKAIAWAKEIIGL